MTSRIPPEQVIADMLLAIRLEERMAEQERIVKILEAEYGRGWVTAASFVRHLVALIQKEKHND